MLVVGNIGYSIPVLSLRAKISHSWLDHEIAMVSEEVALQRWRAESWPPIAERWETLHGLALALGGALKDFGSSSLVDVLPSLQRLSTEEKEDLKASLDLLHTRLIDVPAVQLEFATRLDACWRAAQEFFLTVKNPEATEACVVVKWQAVKAGASELRSMFSSERLPNGIVLP